MPKLPKDFDDTSFQKLCRDILAIKYPHIRFDEYGRNGQKQEGIDLISRPPYVYNRQKVAQCKFYIENDKKSYTAFLNKIKEDYYAACNCDDFDFDEFIILTSLYRDIRTQKELYKIVVKDRQIVTIYWDEIEQIALSHLSILQGHWHYIYNANDNDLFEKEQQKYKSVMRKLFMEYNMWGLVHIPSMRKEFDDDCFYKFDECAAKFNDITDRFRASDYYISSSLTDNIWQLFWMLDSYYSYLAIHCHNNYKDKAVPNCCSIEELTAFDEFKKKLCSQYDLVMRILR